MRRLRRVLWHALGVLVAAVVIVNLIVWGVLTLAPLVTTVLTHWKG